MDSPVIDSGAFLGDDGALNDGWLGQAYGADDPMRTDATLMQTKNVRDLCSQVVHGQKQIGQFTGGREFAFLPNETSSEDEVNAFHTKLGRGATPADYKLGEMQLPEGLAKDDKLAEHISAVLHKAGVSNKAATEIHNGYAEYMKTSMDGLAAQEKLDDATANQELRGKLGAGYDKTMRDIATVVNLFGNKINPTETAELLKDLPNDSFSAQLLGSIVAKFSEGGLENIPLANDGELTPAAAIEERSKIMRDPYYTSEQPQGKPRNKEYHDELVAKAMKLTELSVKGGAS